MKTTLMTTISFNMIEKANNIYLVLAKGQFVV